MGSGLAKMVYDDIQGGGEGQTATDRPDGWTFDVNQDISSGIKGGASIRPSPEALHHGYVD